MSTTVPDSDAELLQQYEKEQSEAAFGALVTRYQAMVLGAAFRRTGNLELAREVAQEVFATLARKARFLTGRASVGGWLHQAAIYQASRTLQSEVRRHARQEHFVRELPTAVAPVFGGSTGSDQLAIVDEALGLLSAADREVIVLHYFQDLSYPEMSKVLGANEAAVRQRVSRALDRLGKRLSEKGIGGNVVVLLLGAVSVQSSIAAPVGLASAALATAAAGGGASAYLLLTAILSKGVMKTAAVLLAVTGTAAVWHEIPVQNPPAPDFAQLSEVQERELTYGYASVTPAGSGEVLVTPGARSVGNRQTDAGNIAIQRPVLPDVPNQALKQSSTPVTVPKVSQSGTPAGSSVLAGSGGNKAAPAVDNSDSSRAVNSRPRETSPTPADAIGSADDPLRDALPSIPDYRFPGLLGELADVGGLPAVIDELLRVERIPQEAAKLYSELLEDVLLLEPVKRTLVEGFLEDHYEQLNEQGIAGIRPREVAQETWQTLRNVKVTEAVEGVQEILSDVAPDPKVIDDVFALVEKPVAEEGILKPLTDIPAEVVGEVVPVLEKVPLVEKIPLPVKLPLLP